MKSAKSAHYLQLDSEICQISSQEGAIIWPSRKAYNELEWTRDYFEQEPSEGYFIWVKQAIARPLTTRISICSPQVSQHPRNLVVLEENVEAEINGVCNATKRYLYGSHIGRSKIILKENSGLKMRHFHKWGKEDSVDFCIDFFMAKGARLSHTYKCLAVPKTIKMENNTFLESYSSANFEVVVLAKGGEVDMYDSTFLNGRKSNAITRIRMVSDKGSRIISHTKMVGNEAGTGHLDCMGILLAGDSSINAIPELINRNNGASLTHEASVGKISEENLNYLRSRGLTEDEAIDLIVAGFLGEEKPIIIKGRAVPSKLYM